MSRRAPGYAFSIPTDVGHALGLLAHRHDFYGDLVWISVNLFDRPPSLAEAAAVRSWRYPIYFLLGSALHWGEVTKVGKVPVPADLQPYPVMRGGSRRQGWWIVHDGSREFDVATSEQTEDWSIPPEHLVDYYWLKDAIETGWVVEDYH